MLPNTIDATNTTQALALSYSEQYPYINLRDAEVIRSFLSGGWSHLTQCWRVDGRSLMRELHPHTAQSLCGENYSMNIGKISPGRKREL